MRLHDANIRTLLVPMLVFLLFAMVIGCSRDPEVGKTVDTTKETPMTEIIPSPTQTAEPFVVSLQATKATPSATFTHVPTNTPAPTLTPEPTATPMRSATATRTPLPTVTATPVSTNTPTPTYTPEPTPTPAATHTPEPTATVAPTSTPEPTSTSTPVPPTPTPDSEAVFDRLIPELLEKWDVPGAAIAVARDGRLVLAKGYGLANVENEEPVEPDSLFRIASISKPVTAVAALQLVEEGLLDLEERVFEILREFESPEGAAMDSRLDKITVRQLLQHSGGWDRDQGYDPMFIAGWIERELGVPKPVSCPDVIRFMLGQPLDFDPGARYAYSNFGYCLLGRVVEKKTGRPYEEYVRERVLEPLGITRMRIGGVLPDERVEGEATYYDYPGQELAYSVMPGTPEQVPWPYGGFYLEDSVGGWIASAIDLVRFATSVNGRQTSPGAEIGHCRGHGVPSGSTAMGGQRVLLRHGLAGQTGE